MTTDDGYHVIWESGPHEGQVEYLRKVYGGWQRREDDGSLTLLVGKQPFRILGSSNTRSTSLSRLTIRVAASSGLINYTERPATGA